MSDTAEMGTPPADPELDAVRRAGIGGGLQPGDLVDGQWQEQELEQERELESGESSPPPDAPG